MDDYHFRAGFWQDPRLILRHAEVRGVAAALGYDPLDFDEKKLMLRYGPA